MSTSATEISKECRWCGMFHSTLCPFVKSIEYFADGTVKRVEFRDYSTPQPIPYPVPYPIPAPVYPQPWTPPLVPWWNGNTYIGSTVEIIPSNWPCQ